MEKSSPQPIRMASSVYGCQHTQDLIDLACQTSGRNMTLAEWQQVLPDQPYRKTCPQWPEGQ